MSLGTTCAVALVGLSGYIVEVQAQVSQGTPGFHLVGLPDAALSESRDRVRSAIISSRLEWKASRVTVNLSPASLPKQGSSFDLAIAVAVLCAGGTISRKAFQEALRHTVHLGELGLDGRLQPVRGVLPMVAAAVKAGKSRIIVPKANLLEAQLVEGAQVIGVATLPDLIELHGGRVDFHPRLPPVTPNWTRPPRRTPGGSMWMISPPLSYGWRAASYWISASRGPCTLIRLGILFSWAQKEACGSLPRNAGTVLWIVP